MALADSDLEYQRTALYCLRSLAKTEEAKNKLIDLGALPKIVT